MKGEMPKQEEETPKEANFEKATMPKEEVPIAKVGSSSTAEKLKERSCELNTKEEEKKVLQELAQGLEQMSVKQNEYVTTPREEHNSRTLKRRRTLESDEAWNSQTAKMKNVILASVSVNPTFRVFFLDQAWGHMSKSYVLFWDWVSYNLLESMKIDLLLEILGIKCFTNAFA